MVDVLLGLALFGQTMVNFIGDGHISYSDTKENTLSLISYSDANQDQKEASREVLGVFVQPISHYLCDKRFKNNILLSHNAVKGVVIYHDALDEDEKTYRKIDYLVINEANRRQGYGTYLMKKMEEDGRKNGIAYIRLKSAIDAIDFYKKIGFQGVIHLHKNIN